ncbi:hypothetical protein NQ318_018135 [Aromia moschata]|uniref:CCHC-type domain-containing protein n=1 Tax=Aromia moschata TaxID=1265417 RepID=A0AAV8ZD81_9CUCU|nr:hypothetical protein NQ318_018135 [Aromia moschata]
MINRYMAILECDPATHTRILEKGSLCISWTPNCSVYDYVRIYRCFKCAKYNHKAADCENNLCVKCGDEAKAMEGHLIINGKSSGTMDTL